MSDPLVSIVIPMYNEEKYVRRCLDSIKDQIYKQIEVIIIDDGSTDKTVDIINEEYKHVKLFKQNHAGVGIATNFGATKAKGEILVFTDADMKIDRDYVEKLVRPIIEKKCFGTVHGRVKLGNPENKMARCWKIRGNDGNVSDNEVYRAILKEKFFEYGGYDPSLGYADDRGLYNRSGIKPTPVIDAEFYHDNPYTLKSIFYQARWIGSAFKPSFKNKFFFVIIGLLFVFILSILISIYYSISYIYFILIFLFIILLNIIWLSTIKVLKEKDISFYYYYPIFYLAHRIGYFTGVFRSIFGKNMK